jgi:NAD(P)-dependent dehydrogenase (short-subunit alcohol dehydrogenase family)
MKTLDKWYDLKGKVIILTGAAGKLGPRYAEVLSECGANVVCLDLNKEKCMGLEKHLRETYNTDPTGVRVDITQKDEVQRVVDDIFARYGKIDVLINNAAYEQLGHIVGDEVLTFEDFPLKIWESTIDVNMTGMFLCSQSVGKVMVRQGSGVILNISSVYGVVAADQRIYGTSKQNSNVAYAATKSAVLNFTRYLASYWQGKNIRVNSLSPGGVFNYQGEEFVNNYSYRTMLGRMADKDDLSAAVLYLVSDASKFVTGFNLIVDGGWTAW